MCRLSWNLGASNSWDPQGLSRPVQGLLYLHIVNHQDFQSCMPALNRQHIFPIPPLSWGRTSDPAIGLVTQGTDWVNECELTSSLFWSVMQCRMVVSYQCFGTTISLTFNCQASVINYQSTPYNIPEEGRSHLHRSGSLKSCRVRVLLFITCTGQYGLQFCMKSRLQCCISKRAKNFQI